MADKTADEIVVKKYSNRRLYDTRDSRYVTLEELARKVQEGSQIQVFDAKSGQDITQATLAQIVLESRRASRLLPVPLLLNLIRMNDQSFSDFFLHHLSSTLENFQSEDSSSPIAEELFRKWPAAGSDFVQRLFSCSPRSRGGANASQLFRFLQRPRPKPEVESTKPNDP
ncbi:MAG: polyhydroxyalkanoate synthesis regulator DNA-binding domain-containing protein [Myxococcales bacterium]|nr:polyhydroxyalkanoate synthesis regulator DNA-binding domain-containing protein [Myxococcales bacterium]